MDFMIDNSTALLESILIASVYYRITENFMQRTNQSLPRQCIFNYNYIITINAFNTLTMFRIYVLMKKTNTHDYKTSKK